MATSQLDARLQQELDELKRTGTYKRMQHLDSPMDPVVEMEGRGQVIVLSSNNYLGLANHPRVVQAGVDGLRRFGAGTASVRFICGTFTVHRELEAQLADLVGCEAALTYVSCWNANGGLIPTLLGEGDAVFSDELNHASIIDGIRMARQARRFVYKHSDMDDLDRLLEENRDARTKLIATDGVFSMEGDLAKLPEIVALARKHGALTFVDDSHGTGVVGKTGRGTAEHFGLLGEVDIITSTLGKALGGAAGGFVAASQPVIGYLVQKSRPQLFSNALPPTVACSALAAVEVLRNEPGLIERLHANANWFRSEMRRIGYEPLNGESAIVPIMVGDTAEAITLSERLLDEGVFVTGFGYPVVPEGTARLRVQLSAAHSDAHLERAIEAFAKLRQAS